MKFGNFHKPTPAKIRKLMLAIHTGCISLMGYAIISDNTKYALAVLAVQFVSTVLAEFFHE